MEQKTITLEVPVGYIYDETTKLHMLFNTKETDKLLGQTNLVITEETLEKAQETYFLLLKLDKDYHLKRSQALDKWKPFQKGPWNLNGGRWLTFFGLHFFFRKGKGMKGGRYIPFTNLNISFYNHWKKSKVNV